MKKLKLFLALLCTVILCQTVNAAEVTVDEIKYSIDASAKTASVIANSYSGDIVIPASFTYEGVDYSVTSIGHYAFYNCSDLTGIKIPNSVTSIGHYAFYGCSGLTSIEIPSSVTSIGSYAFYRSGLTGIEIPSSVTSIGNYAFFGCSNLESISVSKENTVYDSRDNSNAIIETATNTLVTGCKNTVIPSSVTSIGYNAFQGCEGLTNIEIPSSVIEISGQAFSWCSNLESISVSKENTVYDSRDNSNAIIHTTSNTLVTGCKNTVIPSSVTTIGYDAFLGSGLTGIEIPSSVTVIAEGAFSHSSNLESLIVSKENMVYDSRDNCNAIIETTTNTLVVGCNNTVIPGSVTSIGNDAFFGCEGLTGIKIPSSVTEIGDHAFTNCEGLTDIEIPSSVISIGNDAFFGCKGLTDIEIPSSVISIGDYAFYCCEGLTSIVIPSSVTSIGSMAFFGCYNLKSVTSLNPTPPSQSYLAFPSWQATLYVPTGSADAYKNASYWGWAFLNIVEIDVTAIGTVACDGKETGTDIYDLSGRRLSAPKKGINIINGRKVLVR